MKRLATTTLAAGTVAAAVLAGTAEAKMPPLYKNCAHLNAKYQHGLGKVGAHDKTVGTPVTTFKRSNRLFALAMSYNRGLDRDRDGIACEAA
jgi:outer membrane murein-binding lipoprotein Lpp